MIGISLQLRAKFTLVRASPPFALSGLITEGKSSLLITNVYLPPEGSAPDLDWRWESFENHLLSCHTKCPNSYSLIGGDFNARIATNWDLLTKSKWWTPPCLDNFDLEHARIRTSKDNRVNKAGVTLYQMAIRLNLVFLNGTFPPDIPGEFTHLGLTSNSVIDYLLISANLAVNVLSFQVENQHFSDHLPIVTTLSLFRCQNDNKHSVLLETSSSIKIRGIKWSEAVAQKYQVFFHREINAYLPQITTDLQDSNSVLKLFNLLITNLTTFFTSPPQKAKVAHCSAGAPWFNTSCKQARSLLRSIYNEYKNSNAQALPSSYLQAKRAYKQTLKLAKREWYQKRWRALIAASRSRRPQEFWALINKRGRKYPLTIIPAPTWEQFLSKYFSLAEESNSSTELRADHLPLWPSTDPDLIMDLILDLKTGKAPGPDLVPAEAIVAQPRWWAEILAKVFDAINSTGLIPRSWKEAVIVPVHKKGPPADPENYRNISLLSIIGKIYAKFLLSKLSHWANDSNLIGHEQAGFRNNYSTSDHMVIMYHLARKYSAPSRGRLCVAFIDLKAAFDSIPRNCLWKKLERWGIDRRLLWLITQLHHGSSARVRLTPAGNLSNEVPINRGVRQGCILAPLLFNLFISDMKLFLNESQANIHAPRLADFRCPLLLYADDAAILSYSRVGLCRALKIFAAYCKLNHLTINHGKSKVLVFSRSRKTYSWKLDGVQLEQVFKFKYLGVFFHYNLSWKPQIQYLLNKGKTILYTLLQFLAADGASHIPSALKVYHAKVVSTLCYAAPLWAPGSNLTSLGTLQNQFLRRLLKLPMCVSNAAIRLELRIASLETVIWKRVFGYWLSSWHRLPDHYLFQCLWRDVFVNPWVGKIHAKLLSIGISPADSLKMNLRSAKSLIEQRLADIENQHNLARGGGVCSPRYHGITPPLGLPSYMSSLSSVPHRRAFIRARFNVFPSNLLNHRFSKGLVSPLCVCDGETVESLSHIMFNCPLHSIARAKFLGPALLRLVGRPVESHAALLLQDTDPSVTLQVARFLNAVISHSKTTKKQQQHQN